MTPLLAITDSTFKLSLLAAAVLVLYCTGRVTNGAIPTRIDRASVRAFVAVVPVLIVALVAAVMGRTQVAMHLPIACAAAAMTFGVASLIVGRSQPVEGVASRSWSLLVPAVALVLIAGIGGRLDATVLIALALYGFIALAAWAPDPPSDEQGGEARGSVSLSLLIWTAGLIAAGLAGVMAVLGVPALESIQQMPSDALLTVFLLTPAIVVPIFFELLPPCRAPGWTGSVSSLVKFALVCLCFVLPLCVLVVSAQGLFETTARSGIGWLSNAPVPSTMPATRTVEPTATTTAAAVLPTLKFPTLPPIPLRADLLVLTAASLLMIPWSAGRLRPGRTEAGALALCYVLGLMLVILTALR